MYIWILRYKDRRHKSMIDRIGIYFSKKCHESLMKTVYEHTYLILHVHFFFKLQYLFCYFENADCRARHCHVIHPLY